MPAITLGPRKTPLDPSKWDAHCLTILGRIVPFSENLTRTELRALGFTQAAIELPSYYDLYRN